MAVGRRFEPGGWMAAGVNLLQLFDADLGVNGGGVELLVPKQLLDEADVRPVFQHVRGAGVPEQMAASLLGQPAFCTHSVTMRLRTSG